jgi:WD40 repeat protein
MASPVDGKVVVLTGAFSEIKRADASKQLEAMGAIIGKGVTQKTDLLIAGAKAGSKITRAGQLGVEVVGEAWLMAVLSGVDPDGDGLFGEEVAAMDGDALARLLQETDWEALNPGRDLPHLTRALRALERRDGVTDLHRAFSREVLAHAPYKLQHSRVHRNRFSAVALSPCGRYLATGSESPYVNYDDGGDLAIWELVTGRAVSAVYNVDGGIGWTENGGCLKWSADGELIGGVFSTNAVGTFAPFDGRGGPLMSADLTDGWDSAPTFCLSPDGKQICVSCWGGDSRLPGGVVPTVEGQNIWSGRGHGTRWFSDKGLPADEELSPWKEAGWNKDTIYGHGRGVAFAVDAQTLTLKWRCLAHNAAAFSPDGALLAHNPAGLVFYDGATGLPTTQLPMIVGGTDLLWSPVVEQRRLALIVGPGNKFRADPGVHIFDSGELVATVHDAPVRDDPHWNFLDARPFAFSPDGERCALITAGGRIAVWSLAGGGEKLAELAADPRVSGLLWGDGALVAFGMNLLEFWDVERGERFARQDLLPPPGLTDPVPAKRSSWQAQLPGERGYLPVARGARWRWVVAHPDGTVLCDPEEAAALDEVLVFSLAGGRVGWPWRWAEGTARATALTDSSQCKNAKIKSLWNRWKATPATLPAPKERRPMSEYHAPAPLVGAAITEEALAALVGKQVLYAEDWRPRYVLLATLTGSAERGFGYTYKTDGGSGSGSIELKSLHWIGEAVWVGG